MAVSKIKNKKKRKKIAKGLRKGSKTQKVFSLIVSAMKRAGQDIQDMKIYLDEHAWLDPLVLLRGYPYDRYKKSVPSSKEITESTIKRAIKKLEISDYIKITPDKQNKQSKKISLTEKGILEVIRYNIKQRKQKQKWDGKWRIVIFDILEQRRQIRDLLRTRLKWLGFEELQRSVWIFPYDARKEIKQILDVCHIDIIGDVRFLTVEEMNDDKDLRKKFNIG